MKWYNPNAEIFIPDGVDLELALDRTTHMGIGAHQDDIEIAAYHGIAACFGKQDQWFSGVTVTNGSGSPRTGNYAGTTDEEMQKIRREEQRKAAQVGSYSFQVQLDYPSSEVKEPENQNTVNDLYTVLNAAKPEILYLHNPADKHDTHVATMLRSLAAAQKLAPAHRPKKVFGCEVWRDLDWLPDDKKKALDVSDHDNLSVALLSLYDSQITGGKRYDLATAGRRLANATYLATHTTDEVQALTYAIDLTPLLLKTELSVKEYILNAIDFFKKDVASRLDRLL